MVALRPDSWSDVARGAWLASLAILAATCAAPARADSVSNAYALSGRWQDGTPATIYVRGGRWAEVTERAPGADERLVVADGRVIRYGVYGDVAIADSAKAWEYEARTRALTQTLRLPNAAPGSSYVVVSGPPGSMPAVVSRNDGRVEAIRIGPLFYSDFVTSNGVITGWSSSRGDGFAGRVVNQAIPEAAFAKPPSFFNDGDPSSAVLDGHAVKIFIDTGTTGFAVSAKLGLEAKPLGTAVLVKTNTGNVSEPLVRFSSFRQLGVTRRDQVARVSRLVPPGYDALEGIGMLHGLALHFDAKHDVRADHRGCAGGLPFRSWGGNLEATISSSDSGFGGVTVFDTGHRGVAYQRVPPLIMFSLARSRRFIPHSVKGSVHPFTVLCAPQPVEFRMERLGAVSRSVCYAPDFGAGVLYVPDESVSTLYADPIDFFGGAMTIDTASALMCRTATVPD